MNEAQFKQRLRQYLQSRYQLRLFPNVVGTLWTGKVSASANGNPILVHPRRIPVGLCPGSSDLIGWSVVTVTPDMVGRKLAVFTGIETKSKRGQIRPGQERFVDVLLRMGGLGGIVRSFTETDDILAGVDRAVRRQ